MRVGVDTGGTFTDVVAVSADGVLRVHKLPSTPRDPAQAVLDGVRAVAPDGVAELVHSSTVATNALLERRGGPTALLTTAGFEDVLELGRQARPALYALHPVVPAPLVEPERRLGVRERLAADGSVVEPLTDEALAALRERVQALVADGVRSLAVCLLHAHRNPAHERRVAEALAGLGVPVSLSSEVLPLPREYERTSTTVVDAYVRPVTAPYLERLGAESGAAKLRVMQSSGGAMSAGEARTRPVRTLLSGPAAGVVGALEIARAAGIADVITLDMGGTSTDVALVAGGALQETEEAQVGGCPIQVPMLAVHTVGAGGGSIGRVDEGGALKVGPQSAGADPGPAAYGRGGAAPTMTDADLVLGRLDPARFLGGAMRLDPQAARAALEPLAAQLGRSVEGTAEDMASVADAVMAHAIKVISVERGHDPARFTLLAFGGAGAMHACAVARELGIGRVLVPPTPGLLCAYGALAARPAYDVVRTLLRDAGPALEVAVLEPELRALEAAAVARLDADGIPEDARELGRTCTLRYRGQSFELAVPAAGDLVAAFHAAHEARYGYALRGRPVELVTARVRASGRVPPVAPPAEAHEPGPPALGWATCIFGGRVYGAEILARARLRPGDRVAGPALVVEYSATTFVDPASSAEVLEGGALLVTVGGT